MKFADRAYFNLPRRKRSWGGAERREGIWQRYMHVFLNPQRTFCVSILKAYNDIQPTLIIHLQVLRLHHSTIPDTSSAMSKCRPWWTPLPMWHIQFHCCGRKTRVLLISLKKINIIRDNAVEKINICVNMILTTLKHHLQERVELYEQLPSNVI